MRDSKSYIKVVECKTPEELIDWLQSKKNININRKSFIFRGQSDSKWGLTPSVFRPKTKTSYVDSSIGPALNLADQVNREMDLIKAFAKKSNRVGLEIPSHLETLLEIDSPLFETYPNPAIIEFMSIAQHHGVPTRLLDFTFDPLVACYFAATDQVDLSNMNRPGSIAVWAVNNLILTYISRIEHYEPIRYRNRYLHAQDGVFILDRGLNASWKNGLHLFDIDQVIIQEIPIKIDKDIVFNSLINVPGIEPIYKFTLPFQECNKLLELLNNYGINSAKISPSYRNIVRFLEQQRTIKIKRKRALRDVLLRKLS